MSSNVNPTIKQQFDRSNVASILNNYIRKAHDDKKAQKMANLLDYHLEKVFPDKKTLKQALPDDDGEIELRSRINDCLHKLHNTNFNRFDESTSSTLLTLARLLIKIRNRRIAAEMIWCAASIEVQDFIATRKISVILKVDGAKRRFVRTLSSELMSLYIAAEYCHDAFYSHHHDDDDLMLSINDTERFIEKLRSFELTDEKRKELESKEGYNDE